MTFLHDRNRPVPELAKIGRFGFGRWVTLKGVRLLVGLLALAVAAVESASAEAGQRSAAVKAAAVAGIRYDPTIRERVVAEAAAETGEVVQMERFVFSETELERQVEAVIAQQREIVRESKFAPATGGLFWEGKLGGLPATIGFAPLRDVMNGGTKFNGDPAMFRWNILELKL